MGWKHPIYHINNYDSGHTRWKKQLAKNLKTNFASLSTLQRRGHRITAAAKTFALHENATMKSVAFRSLLLKPQWQIWDILQGVSNLGVKFTRKILASHDM